MKVKAIKVKRKLERDLKRVRTPEEAMQIAERASEVARQRVLDEPEVRTPGLTIAGAKTAWTKRDLEEKFPLVTWTPEETIPLCFNGVHYQAFMGFEWVTPSVIKTIYDNHRKVKMQQDNMLKDANIQGGFARIGEGGLPPELV